MRVSESRKKQMREYHQKNKERDRASRSEYGKKHYKKNKGIKKVKAAAYYIAKKEEINKKQLDYYYKNKDGRALYVSKNNDKIKAYHKEYNMKTSAKESNKDFLLKKNYGISLVEYNEMFVKQSGKCFICGIHQSELKRALFVDHCHKTKKVRGLLCHKCNSALGLVFDNTEILSNMIKYLNR